jgi:ATP-dependent exoDNAse (exonuclease V) beta subunit
VDLLSVHKAKGLEFDAVYIIDVVEKTGNQQGIVTAYPPTYRCMHHLKPKMSTPA